MKKSQTKEKSNLDFEKKSAIYLMYSNYMQNIKHFDLMQTTYRVMTSTAMLATFTAIGFIFSSRNTMLPIDRLLVVILVCLFGIVSILTLWHLDLIFYERLLTSNFVEALKLEQKNKWLPKVHQNMIYGHAKQDKPANVALFYNGCGSSLILTSGITLIYLLKNDGKFALPVILLGTIAFLFLYIFIVKKMTGRIEDQIKKLHKTK